MVVRRERHAHYEGRGTSMGSNREKGSGGTLVSNSGIAPHLKARGKSQGSGKR